MVVDASGNRIAHDVEYFEVNFLVQGFDVDVVIRHLWNWNIDQLAAIVILKNVSAIYTAIHCGNFANFHSISGIHRGS